MIKNALAVLANNMTYTETLVNNMPESAKKYKWYVITDTRLGDHTYEIRQMFKGLNAEVIPSSTITEAYAYYFEDSEFLRSYTMSMNILVQWYLFKIEAVRNLFYFDDDVLLGDVDLVFNNGKSKFALWKNKNAAESFVEAEDKDQRVHREWDRMFKLDLMGMGWEKYVIENNLMAGHRVYSYNDFDLYEYENYLKMFFGSEVFFDVWKNRTHHTECWLDQKFEGFFLINTGILNNNLGEITRMRVGTYKQEDMALWHNGVAGCTKLLYYGALMIEGKLKENTRHPINYIFEAAKSLLPEGVNNDKKS